MAIYGQSSTAGANMLVAVPSSGSTRINYYISGNALVGVARESSASLTQTNAYRMCVKFAVPSGGVPWTEPQEADQSEPWIFVKLNQRISGVSVCVKAMRKNLSYGAEARYSQLAPVAEIGTLDGGVTALFENITKEQLELIAQYGVGLAPVDGWTPLGQLVTGTDATETQIGFTPKNPASKGVARDFLPGALTVLIGNEAQEISYKYLHPYGGYAQGLLGVLAVNADTGERVVICKKAAQTVESGETGTFTIPAGTLSAGTWDITVSAAPAASASYYAADDDFWLTGQTVRYVVKDNPEAGSVACDGHPVPTVTWTASAQAAYQVRFGDYDSGARAGSAGSFTVPRIFADGAYPVRVRTATAAGEWSAWSETIWAAVRNVAPAGTMTLAAETEDGCVRLTWEDLQPTTGALLDSGGAAVLDSDGEELITTTDVPQADRYAVFRDGELIGVTDEAVFTDRIGGGEYQVLAMTGTYYIPSNTVTYWPRLACDMISADGGESWLTLKYTPELKSEPETVTTEITYYYYAGRSKPVAVSTGQVTREKNFAYRFKRRADAQKIRAMNGAEVILKTTRGEWIAGVLENIGYQDAKIVTVSFAIRETETEAEHVEYTV